MEGSPPPFLGLTLTTLAPMGTALTPAGFPAACPATATTIASDPANISDTLVRMPPPQPRPTRSVAAGAELASPHPWRPVRHGRIGSERYALSGFDAAVPAAPARIRFRTCKR